MSDDVLNNAEEVVETVEVEQELVENEEILDEEETLEEASKKNEGEHDEEEEEEEVKEAAPVTPTPKTKAGVIQAAVEMLKKGKKRRRAKNVCKVSYY